MAAKKSLNHPGPARAQWVSGGRRWRQILWTQRPPTRYGNSTASTQPGATGRIDWVGTLVAKGPKQLDTQHLRHRHEAVHRTTLYVIALDTSGSMRRGGALEQAKGLAGTLVAKARRQGDDVALLGFGGQGVQLLLPPQTARLAAVTHIRPLGGGGGTPLADCMQQVQRLLLTRQRQQPGAPCVLWLLTDGRSVHAPERPRQPAQAVIVNFDDPLHPVGRCPDWAESWRAICWQFLHGPAPAHGLFTSRNLMTP